MKKRIIICLIAVLSIAPYFIVATATAQPKIIVKIEQIDKPYILQDENTVNVIDIFNISNKERINNGSLALKLNSKLTNAAKEKAKHMISNNYWAHIAPDGTTPWTFIESSNYDYYKAGENLAKGFDTSNNLVIGWMNSPTHRKTCLITTSKMSDM